MQWSRTPRVIVLDDERVIADTLVEILCLNGCDAVATYSAGEALQVLDEDPPDLLLTDVALDPDSINGIDVANYYQRECPNCKVLLISGHAASTDLLFKARSAGHDFRLLQKPVHPNELLAAIEDVLGDLVKKVA